MPFAASSSSAANGARPTPPQERNGTTRVVGRSSVASAGGMAVDHT